MIHSLRMMTSSNGNISRVTGSLRREFTGPRWIPHTEWSGDLMFSLICAWKKRVSKQLWGCWYDTPSCLLWHHCNVVKLFGYFDWRAKNKGTTWLDTIVLQPINHDWCRIRKEHIRDNLLILTRIAVTIDQFRLKQHAFSAKVASGPGEEVQITI